MDLGVGLRNVNFVLLRLGVSKSKRDVLGLGVCIKLFELNLVTVVVLSGSEASSLEFREISVESSLHLM